MAIQLSGLTNKHGHLTIEDDHALCLEHNGPTKIKATWYDSFKVLRKHQTQNAIQAMGLRTQINIYLESLFTESKLQLS